MGCQGSKEALEDTISKAHFKHTPKDETKEIVEGLQKTCRDTTGSKFTCSGDVKDTHNFKYMEFTECPKFAAGKNKSAMAKYVTPALWDSLKDKKSNKGYSLSNAVQTGCLLPHLGVGCTAGDEDSWEVFKDLYYPVIKEWHDYDAATQTHPTDLNYENLRFDSDQQALFNKYVASTRIRAARNISGFALPCGTTKEDRAGVEAVLKKTFDGLSGDLKGKYYSLETMSDENRAFLLDKGYLFQIPTARNLLMGAGAARNWPENRGIFHNDNHTALAWCNEEDHCRIISMDMSGDIPKVFKTFCELSNALKASADANGTKLMWTENLGFLGTCPSNLGTGLRASVMIKLTKFNEILEDPNSSHEDKELLEQVCSAFDLQPRGSAGEHSPAKNAKFDVSNKQRLGYSEVQLVQKMIDGVTKVIELEEMLASGSTPAQVREKVEEMKR
jgi:creatine kinase